ncbi:glycerophosphodiester phosphodiesterase family protein [Aeromonas sp. MdU4]|uniref:glycerophosphodiester phosphodiesterase family protein n=1 Tax=Aeromonas sp. MdU4 TaxID=3342819 RepID=UPI0035B7F14C
MTKIMNLSFGRVGVLTASLICCSATAAWAADSGPAPIYKMRDGDKVVEVYAHRGARSFAPENSMPGYKTALRIGSHWMDGDVVMTKEGEIVVSHDLWLNPDLVRDPHGKFLAASKADLIKDVPQDKLTEFLQPYMVKNKTVAEVQKYDVGKLNPGTPYAKFFPNQSSVDGTYMPTLREAIRYHNKVTGGKVGFQIEMKNDPGHEDWSYSPAEFAVALYKVMKEEGIIDNAEIQAFDWRCLYELQKLDKNIRTAYLTEWDNEVTDPKIPEYATSFYNKDPKLAGAWTGGKLVKDYNNSIPQMIKALGGTNWEPEDVELTKASLDEAHRLGLKVVVWTWPEHSGTVLDPVVVARLIDWGVDGIITDDPGQLISLLAARGYKVPERFDVE